MSGLGGGGERGAVEAICPECKAQPPDYSHLPSFVHVPPPIGVLHNEDCPTLPRLTDEEQRELNAALAEIAECRRRAWATAHNYWLH